MIKNWEPFVAVSRGFEVKEEVLFVMCDIYLYYVQFTWIGEGGSRQRGQSKQLFLDSYSIGNKTYLYSVSNERLVLLWNPTMTSKKNPKQRLNELLSSFKEEPYARAITMH